MKRPWVTLILLGSLALFILSAGVRAEVKVMVGVAPIKYLVERIGGSRVSVAALVPPGASPATYEPKPRQMAALSKAAAYFGVGLPVERAWLPRIKAANPKLRIIHTASGLKRLVTKAGHGDHDHGGLDPHVWTSPKMVRGLIKTIRDELTRLDPDGKAKYAANEQALAAEVDRLDAELSRIFSDLGERNHFLVFHPAWGYLARDYGLKQMAIEMEGKSPSAKEMKHIIDLGAKYGWSAVFIQPQFSQRQAGVVSQALGARLVVIDPLAEDWADNLLQVARKLRPELR